MTIGLNVNQATAQQPPLANIIQWQRLPNTSLADLIQRGLTVVGTELEHIEKSASLVNIVYLYGRSKDNTYELLRCIEYTREFQMETINFACYRAIQPVENN